MTDAVVPTLARAATGDVNLVARRMLFAALVLTTIGGLIWLAAHALAPGGIRVLDKIGRAHV